MEKETQTDKNKSASSPNVDGAAMTFAIKQELIQMEKDIRKRIAEKFPQQIVPSVHAFIGKSENECDRLPDFYARSYPTGTILMEVSAWLLDKYSDPKFRGVISIKESELSDEERIKLKPILELLKHWDGFHVFRNKEFFYFQFQERKKNELVISVTSETCAKELHIIF